MPCQWALYSDSGALLQQGHAPLATLPSADDYVAIIPAERVLCASVKMPPGSRRRWQAALPFIAEEYTLPDPEENHVVPGQPRGDGTLPLFIVDKHWLRNIIETCSAAGIVLRRAIPEMLLPAMPDEHSWVLVWDGSSGFVRTGPTTAAALDTGNDRDAPVALRLAFAAPDHLQPSAIEIRFPYPLDEAAHTLPQWQDFPVRLFKGKAWDWRREPIAKETPDLLWGEFAPRTKFSEWLPKLRPLAVILLIALSIEVIGTHIEWALLAQERSELSSRMARIFRSTFGEGSTLVNAPLQTQRNLTSMRHTAGLADDGDFIPLLDRAAPVLTSLPAGSLRALNYESGQLEVSLRLGKADDFRRLQQQLQGSGLDVRVGKVADTGNAAEAKLLLRPETSR